MGDDHPHDLEDMIQWLITLCLGVTAVILFGVLVGALLRGTGVR